MTFDPFSFGLGMIVAILLLIGLAEADYHSEE